MTPDGMYFASREDWFETESLAFTYLSEAKNFVKSLQMLELHW